MNDDDKSLADGQPGHVHFLQPARPLVRDECGSFSFLQHRLETTCMHMYSDLSRPCQKVAEVTVIADIYSIFSKHQPESWPDSSCMSLMCPGRAEF